MANETESGVPQEAQNWKAPDDSKKTETTTPNPEQKTEASIERPAEVDIDQKADSIVALRNDQQEEKVKQHNIQLQREIDQNPELLQQEENVEYKSEKTQYRTQKEHIQYLADNGPKSYGQIFLDRQGYGGWTQEDFKVLADKINAKEQEKFGNTL